MSAQMYPIIYNLQLIKKIIKKYKMFRMYYFIQKNTFLKLTIGQDRKLRLAQTDKVVLWQSCSTKVKINTVKDQELEVVICRSSTSSITSYLSAFCPNVPDSMTSTVTKSSTST